MTSTRGPELTRSARRRLLVSSLLRSAVAVAVLLVAYSTAPLDRPLDAGTWVTFAAGLLAFGGIVIWQVQVVMRSRTPRLQAIQTVAIGLPLLLVLFAASYVVIATNVPDSFTQPLDRIGSLYFTVTVFTTVGFGDIAPLTDLARVLTTLQMLVGVTVVGVIAKILFGAVEVAERRRESEPSED
ncbi:potassium channel family protein [Pseudonocardia pini]|uniref:potassium channel family protein n=1 Tax=Pseudonocardia pini TaxID=2758030 RepID=UPI0015F04312|nr:potassium channel family protein [Pseudonocardia pini]